MEDMAKFVVAGGIVWLLIWLSWVIRYRRENPPDENYIGDPWDGWWYF